MRESKFKVCEAIILTLEIDMLVVFFLIPNLIYILKLLYFVTTL